MKSFHVCWGKKNNEFIFSLTIFLVLRSWIVIWSQHQYVIFCFHFFLLYCSSLFCFICNFNLWSYSALSSPVSNITRLLELGCSTQRIDMLAWWHNRCRFQQSLKKALVIVWSEKNGKCSSTDTYKLWAKSESLSALPPSQDLWSGGNIKFQYHIISVGQGSSLS